VPVRGPFQRLRDSRPARPSWPACKLSSDGPQTPCPPLSVARRPSFTLDKRRHVDFGDNLHRFAFLKIPPITTLS
jgi:hypothetical protein